MCLLLVARQADGSNAGQPEQHRRGMSAFVLFSSGLPPGSDLQGGAAEGPNLTRLGSFDPISIPKVFWRSLWGRYML
jgi:hypothetical protein